MSPDVITQSCFLHSDDVIIYNIVYNKYNKTNKIFHTIEEATINDEKTPKYIINDGEIILEYFTIRKMFYSFDIKKIIREAKIKKILNGK